jgi:hypothetical protein
MDYVRRGLPSSINNVSNMRLEGATRVWVYLNKYK